jgi:hypothetical protein
VVFLLSSATTSARGDASKSFLALASISRFRQISPSVFSPSFSSSSFSSSSSSSSPSFSFFSSSCSSFSSSSYDCYSLWSVEKEEEGDKESRGLLLLGREREREEGKLWCNYVLMPRLIIGDAQRDIFDFSPSQKRRRGRRQKRGKGREKGRRSQLG